jgi:UDP:flavonoid glycosyltransferase YjiC (YdhE family)
LRPLRTYDPLVQVLASVRPYRGHLQPVIPLLDALTQAGHHVVVATTDELAIDVEQRGFGWLAAGASPARLLAAHTAEDPSYGVVAIRAKAQDLLDSADDVRPDVVLRDATDLAAALVAEVLQVPVATYSVCHYLPIRLWRRLAGRSLATLRPEFGLPADPALAGLTTGPYLDVMPGTMQVPEVAELSDHRVIRYVARDEDVSVAPAAVGSLEPPAVLVTLGTVFSDRDRVWRTFLSAMAEVAGTVVATGTSPGYGEQHPNLPGNVRLVGYVPHSLLLPGCEAIVCHGGFNTVLGAICAGVPLVCVPLAGDQYHNAGVVEQLGLGRRLAGSRLTQRQLREAVSEVRGDPSYARRVASVRREIAELPPASSVVALLEGLVSSST